LGLRLIGMGSAAAAGWPLAEVARPALEALRDETGESVQLYVRDGDHRVCLVSLDSPHELRTIVPEGARLPLHVGSAGRLLAAATTSSTGGRPGRGRSSVPDTGGGVGSDGEGSSVPGTAVAGGSDGERSSGPGPAGGG